MIDAAIFVSTLNKKPVAVFGLGKSNLAVIRALLAAGAKVTADDDNAEAVAIARSLGARIADLSRSDLSDHACLVLAPGVPLNFPAPHPVAANALRAGLEILCDVEVLHRCRLKRRVIGITGTNGKSTTTALLGHILDASGVSVSVGGNIGTAAFDLDLPPENGFFVLELSSFQLDLCPTFAPEIAILLNVEPDHIDRHGDMNGYIRAKARILRGHGTGVVAVDDMVTRRLFEETQDAGYRALTPVSAAGPLTKGVFVQDGWLTDGEQKFDLRALPTLRGVHNHQNIAAAYAAAKLAGVAPDKIIAALQTFPGLAHRQFRVGQIGNISFIDDSKATNAAAAARALAAFQNIYWIAGGRAKEGGLNGLEKSLENVRRAYLIGEAAEEFGQWLEKRGIDTALCGTLDIAVAEAAREAQEDGYPDATILLSPACASYDQFRNFEERGKAFATLVQQLKP